MLVYWQAACPGIEVLPAGRWWTHAQATPRVSGLRVDGEDASVYSISEGVIAVLFPHRFLPPFSSVLPIASRILSIGVAFFGEGQPKSENATGSTL